MLYIEISMTYFQDRYEHLEEYYSPIFGQALGDNLVKSLYLYYKDVYFV